MNNIKYCVNFNKNPKELFSLNLQNLIKYYHSLGCTYFKLPVSSINKNLSNYCNINLKSTLYSEVESKEDIEKLSKFTNLCEVNYKNKSLLPYIVSKFEKYIITINNADTDILKDIYYSYNPYKIMVDTDRNLNTLNNISGKIGNIELGYKSDKSCLYNTVSFFDIYFFEKDSNYIHLSDIQYEKMIRDMNIVKKSA